MCEMSYLGMVVVLIIHAISWNVRRSRCTMVQCGWGCINCTRSLMTENEMAMDTKPSLELTTEQSQNV